MDVEFLRHQFEDGHDGVIVKSEFRFGVRHLQIAYMLVVATTLGILRGSTGVAVLALTDVTRQNDTNIQIFNWDGKFQGTVLSSFLFGYALMLVPAELFMRRVKTGGKHLLTAVLVVSGALAVAMPTIIKKGGWIALCNAQLWMGAVQACLAPANQSLLARFLLPSEKTFFSIIVNSGTILGIMIGLPISGMLSETRLGWELIFYSQAMLTISLACLWGLLTASTPDQHEAMGDKEKEYISQALSSFRKKVLHVPWRNILKSRHFWATASGHAASNAVFIFILFYTPVYFQTFGVSLRESSWLSWIPFIALLMRITTAPTIDWICKILQLNFQVNLTYLRKFINAVGACGVIAGLTVLPNLTLAWPHLTLTVLAIVFAMMGFQFCGFLESYKDMSENYQGSLFLMSRAVASIVGAFVPVVVGTILGHDFNDTGHWHGVFFSLASLYVVCNFMFTAIGTSDRQYWDGGIVVKDKFGYHNSMLDNQLELEELSHMKRPDDDNTANTAI